MKTLASIMICIALVACEKDHPPICIITSPSHHSVYKMGDTIPISISASDSDGLISEINLYFDNQDLITLNMPPYDYALNTGEYSAGTFYIKAFAIDNDGLAATYKRKVVILTSLPTVTTNEITEIDESRAICGGEVVDDGGDSLTSRGVCWSTSKNPTITDSLTLDGFGTGTFTSSLSGLSCGTLYYVRAFTTNLAGTAYGAQVEFTTSECSIFLPIVTTISISDITDNTANSGGNVTDDGGATVTAKGVCWSTSQTPTLSDSHSTDGSGTGGFTSLITGLSCGTTFYMRAYATNSAGTAYGSQINISTSSCIVVPTVSTTSVSSITETSAQGGGTVTDDGGSTFIAGVCWSIFQNPTVSDSKTTDESETGVFSSSLTGLNPNTTYFVRAFAINKAGIAYGKQLSFTTSSSQNTVTDYDGNVYNTVVIGDQTWMADNLKTTHYSDGTAIPLVENESEWYGLTNFDKAHCWYDNNASNREIPGALYNWPAAMNGSMTSDSNPSGVQGVCPDGWHVPSDDEWKELEIYLGLSQADADEMGYRGSNEGGKLKKRGTSLWYDLNIGTSDESGFKALPSGTRSYTGVFENIHYYASFWTSTEYSQGEAWIRELSYKVSTIARKNGGLKSRGGKTIRCVKDSETAGDFSGLIVPEGSVYRFIL